MAAEFLACENRHAAVGKTLGQERAKAQQLVELIDTQNKTLEGLGGEITRMKQSDYSELKLEWDRLQKDEQGLNKEFTIKSNTYASLQKQLSESAA